MNEPASISDSALVLRPAGERFHSERGWLNSWHSFSFAGHHHPDWMGFGPLQVINDDVIAAGQGFGMHPHRDMEIITVMVEGQLNHRDSIGHSGVIHAGDVQRMSAGTGIVHSEVNEGDVPCRLLQIWIEPDELGLSPSYEQRQIAIGTDWTPLIAPDQPEVMAIARPVMIWRAQPPVGAELALPAFGDESAWIQMIDGNAELTGEAANAPIQLGRGDGLGLLKGTTNCSLRSSSGSSSGSTNDRCDALLFLLS
ncbi:MAG: hypothetical protein CMN97_06825 [Synechococcus sp. NAT40]|nr:hypothetical protein [Synechococcus sp. NAT40]